jgi:MFS family permease
VASLLVHPNSLRQYDAGRDAEPIARAGNLTLPRTLSFWLLAALLVFLLCAATAPSPLYAVYQQLWHFPAVTLTVIYAAYAIGGLVALLTTGRLSDYLGRRLVLFVALLVQILAMLLFVAANDVPTLILGRFVVGLGTGCGLGAIGAWLLDLQPPGQAGLGTLINGVATLAGLGLGAFGAGLLVQYAPDPLHLVFWLLAAGYAVALVAILAIPDSVERRGGWLATLRPTAAVPPTARQMFVAAAPGLVGTFALTGLYMSLGPSLALSILHTDNRVPGGLVILALIAPGVATAIALHARDARWVLVRSSAVLVVGVGITVLGVWLSSVALLYVGSVVAGIGFGPALSAFLRGVAPLVAPERRGALLSATYVVVYLSFSVPAVIGGVAVSVVGLATTIIGYGLVVMILAASTAIAVSRSLAKVEPART